VVQVERTCAAKLQLLQVMCQVGKCLPPRGTKARGCWQLEAPQRLVCALKTIAEWGRATRNACSLLASAACLSPTMQQSVWQ